MKAHPEYFTFGVLFAALSALAGCGPRDRAATPEDPAAAARKTMEIEAVVLRDLAAVDARLAARAHVDPDDSDLRKVVMAAVLAEEAGLGIVDGRIDTFSFDARRRGIAAAREKLAGLPQHPSASFEREVATRLIEEESARLEEERDLPRSASILVRGLVETWTPPASPQAMGERDQWLARRLADVRRSIEEPSARPLDVSRARELDDALDALERLSSAAILPASTAELVKLRNTLEERAPAKVSTPATAILAKSVQVHLGVPLDGLDQRLGAAQAKLHRLATEAIASVPVDDDPVGGKVAALVTNTPPCSDKVDGSLVRSMNPPVERSAACVLRHALASEVERPFAWAAMHDSVVIARWALGVAHGETLASVTAKHRPVSRPTPDLVAKMERLAQARPVAAIGGGVAAALLVEAPDPIARARAWSALGDVPFDIAARSLAGQ